VVDIERAFGVAPPPAEPLVEAEYLRPAAQGDEGATEYFSGKSWKGLEAQWLRYHEAAMYMFTPRAHQYYLPAFMLASLQEPREADVIPDNIIGHFASYEDPFWWERIRVFTPAQCDVIAAFIRTVADSGHEPKQIEQALAGLERVKQGG
jgi:hypothetical protein